MYNSQSGPKWLCITSSQDQILCQLCQSRNKKLYKEIYWYYKAQASCLDFSRNGRTSWLSVSGGGSWIVIYVYSRLRSLTSRWNLKLCNRKPSRAKRDGRGEGVLHSSKTPREAYPLTAIVEIYESPAGSHKLHPKLHPYQHEVDRSHSPIKDAPW